MGAKLSRSARDQVYHVPGQKENKGLTKADISSPLNFKHIGKIQTKKYYKSSPNMVPNIYIKKTKPRIHQFTNLKRCKMFFKSFKMKRQDRKCFLK